MLSNLPIFMSLMRVFMKFLWFFLLFLCFLPEGFSHRIRHIRELFLYIGKSKIELRISYVIPAGDRALNIRKRFDINKNGFIDDRELKHLKRFVARDAVKGLKITFQKRPVNIYAYDVNLDFARESDLSLEIRADLKVPIWLAPAPPPPYFKVGIMEERFSHTHITVKSEFSRVKFEKGKLSEGEGFFYGEIKRFEPLVIKVLWE